ncbi:MAG: oligosaccharide flippase family protein, partial [Akkermansia muciniphila]
MAEENSNKRIARNTILLYTRSLVNLVIGLYTSRLTLDALGIADYGIYNVVGSLVALFGLFNGSLNTAISRFITYELGRNNNQRLNKVFSSSLSILFIFALVIFILGETVGLWAVNCRMVFPADRMNAVNWVYQISLMTFLISLLNVAYTATLTAHENFRVLATVEILLTGVKVICVILLYYVPMDRLIYFAGYSFLLTLASSGFYALYCSRHYPCCRYRAILD